MKYFGIHSEGDSFLVAAINRRLKPIFLASFPKNKKFTLRGKFLFQNKRFVSGLNTNNVLVKKISLNIKRRSIAKKALSLQANTLFSFENKSSVVIPILKSNHKGIRDYLLYGTTISKIRKCITDLEEKNISIHTLCYEPVALARFANTYFPPYKFSFIVHIGEIKTVCVFLEEGFPTFSHTIKIGKNDLFQGLDPNKPFDLELIDESKKDATSIKWVQFKNLITQAFLSIKSEEKVYLLLCGHLENAINIEKFLFSLVQENILSYGKESFSSSAYNDMRKYAISIGYCIDAMKNDKKSIQFIQKDCLPRKEILSFYKKVFFLSFFVICFLLASFQYQSKHAKIKEKAIGQRFYTLKEFDEKQMGRSINLSETGTLSDKMDKFQNAISKEGSFFPYIFKKLKTTDMLSLILKQVNFDILKSFQYKVESHPTIKKPLDKTTVKITLHLNGNHQEIELLKSALLKEKYIKKIEHISEANNHKISFYLE